jgi:hypothetical protein
MTAHRDLKRIIRERQKKTGESYTTARAQVMRARAVLLNSVADAPTAGEPVRVEDYDTAGEALGLRRADAGANAILLESRDDTIYEAAVEIDGLRLAPWTLVAADLLTGPGRSPAEAEALLDWMGDHEEVWRG